MKNLEVITMRLQNILNEAFVYEVKELINLGKQYIQNIPTG